MLITGRDLPGGTSGLFSSGEATVPAKSSITSGRRHATTWRFARGRQNTVLFLGGLPFQQRHGTRMLDVILLTENEKAAAFELAVGLDREYPMQAAQGIVTPSPLVAVQHGPPAGGTTGWLFHLDLPTLLLTSLRPTPDGADAIVARIKECGEYGGSAELRCPRRRNALNFRMHAANFCRLPRYGTTPCSSKSRPATWWICGWSSDDHGAKKASVGIDVCSSSNPGLTPGVPW